MKFLIAGSGSIGRRHIRNLLSLGETDITLFRTHQATLPDDELKRFPVETDLHKALENQPDAVIISNPTSKHMDVALPASQAGIHMLIEKPVSDSLVQTDQLAEVIAQNGCRVLVGFQFRFHPVLQQVRQLLLDGAMGKVISIRAHWGEYLPGWHPWEDYRVSYASRNDLGGGVVLTLSHPLDYLRWMVGEVKTVSANIGKISELELSVDDNAEITLEFASGCVGQVHLDYYQRPPEHRLEITTSEGTIQWQNASGAARVYHVERGWSDLQPPVGFDRNDMFIAEMRHFLEVVRGNQDPVCSFNDGVSALKIALGAHRSTELQGKAVGLDA